MQNQEIRLEIQKKEQFSREMQQTVPETGPEFLKNLPEPQSRQKNRPVLISLVSSLLFLEPLHGEDEKESTQKTEETRTD